MTDNQPTKKTGWKFKVYCVLTAMLLVAILWFVYYRVGTKSKLQQRFAAIRAAGYPVTCAELDDWYAIPPGEENAADTLQEAFSHYTMYSDPDPADQELMQKTQGGAFPARSEAQAELIKILAARHLASNEQTISLLHLAAGINHCRYPANFRDGFGVLLRHLSKLRACTNLLKLEAFLHAENGEPELAARSIGSIFGLARSLSSEPIIISQLVRISCQATGVRSLEHAVNRCDFNDEQLHRLGGLIAAAEDVNAVSRGIAGERCFGVDIFARPGPEKVAMVGSPPGPLMAIYSAIGLADAEALVYLDLMEGYINAKQLPLHQRRKAAAAVEAELQKLPRIYAITRMIAPALGRITEIDLKNIAALRTARVGLTVQRYRLASGKLPETLGKLVPTYLDAIPKDPFDGNNLRYRKLDAGFVVYSVGEDGKDDFGTEASSPRRTQGCDITFIVEH